MDTLIAQKRLRFVTPGIIDPLSWTVMGINAKEKDSAIGFFGTGLKFSIAVGIREGWTITIRSHDGEGSINRHTFSKKTTSFRGKDFELIQCNGHQLSYSTELGKNWKPWMALRELVCNTWDENGSIELLDGDLPQLEPGRAFSEIIVEGASALEAYENFDHYFCRDHLVLAKIKDVEVLAAREQGGIFYKGVRVMEVSSSLFSYNILCPVDLTEDRTLLYPTYEGNQVMRKLFVNLKDEGLARRLMTVKDDSWEDAIIECPSFENWSEECRKVALELFEKSPTKLHRKCVRAILIANPSKGFEQRAMDVMESSMLNKATMWLATAGLPVTATIRMVANSDTENVAFVHEGVIHLTERAFAKGTHYLVSTLVEEQAHVNGYHDCDRTYEQHLIDLLVNQAARRIGLP